MAGLGIGRAADHEAGAVGGFSVRSVLYVWANFDVRVSCLACTSPRDGPAAARGRLRSVHACADADPASRRALQDRRDRAGQPPLRRGAAEFPEDRGAPSELLAKIDKCRERIAQKEVWVANYYFTQGNPSAARQRLELVLKDYPRTAVIPETLFLLAEVNFYEGKNAEATELLRRLSVDYDF